MAVPANTEQWEAVAILFTVCLLLLHLRFCMKSLSWLQLEYSKCVSNSVFRIHYNIDSTLMFWLLLNCDCFKSRIILCLMLC